MLLLQAELVALDVIHDVVAFAALLDETDVLGSETEARSTAGVKDSAPAVWSSWRPPGYLETLHRLGPDRMDLPLGAACVSQAGMLVG